MYLRFYGGSASMTAPFNFNGVHSAFKSSDIIDDLRNLLK